MPPDRPNTLESPRRWMSTFIQLVVEPVALFLIIWLILGAFEVHSVSMEPNLHEGQRVLVLKDNNLWPTWIVGRAEAAPMHGTSPFAPRRGQVVVFYDSADRSMPALIKRVIGTPGDTIEFRDGAVLVNGQQISEPYVNGQRTTCGRTCGPITLGPNEYFFMGDNRSNSRDSRSFGPIPVDQIVGQVVVRYWPLDKITFSP